MLENGFFTTLVSQQKSWWFYRPKNGERVVEMFSRRLLLPYSPSEVYWWNLGVVWLKKKIVFTKFTREITSINSAEILKSQFARNFFCWDNPPIFQVILNSTGRGDTPLSYIKGRGGTSSKIEWRKILFHYLHPMNSFLRLKYQEQNVSNTLWE